MWLSLVVIVNINQNSTCHIYLNPIYGRGEYVEIAFIVQGADVYILTVCNSSSGLKFWPVFRYFR